MLILLYFLPILLTFLIEPNLVSIFMIMDFLPLSILIHLFLTHNHEKNNIIYKVFSFLLLLIPVFQNYKHVYAYSMTLTISILISAWFIYKIFHLRKLTKLSRNFYLLSGLTLSYIAINQIWNVLIFTHLSLFLFPTLHLANLLLNLFDNKDLFSFIWFGYSSDNYLSDYLSNSHKSLLFMKTIMIVCWSFAWLGLYWVASQGHKGLLSFNSKYNLFKNKFDFLVFLVSVFIMLVRVYSKTYFEPIFIGIFALYFIHAILLFMVLFLFYSLICEIYKKPIYLLNLLSLSIFIISLHVFEYFHDWLSLLPGIYSFANHQMSSFSTALSFTFISNILISIYTVLFVSFIFKKYKFSVNFLITNISFFSIFSIVFLTHHFMVAPTVNNANDIFEKVFISIVQSDEKTQKLLIQEFDSQHLYPITISNYENLETNLKNCQICKIDSSKEIDFLSLKKKLDDNYKNQNFSSFSMKQYNVKLVFLSVNKNGDFIYTLRFSNYLSFFTVLLYSVFYLIILTFWLFIIFYIQKVHKLLKVKTSNV